MVYLLTQTHGLHSRFTVNMCLRKERKRESKEEAKEKNKGRKERRKERRRRGGRKTLLKISK